MTRIEFDPASGRLRLEAAAFESMVAAAANPSAVTQDLQTAGVFVGIALHPKLVAGVGAVRAPTCQLRIVSADLEGTRVHQGWVSPEAATFLFSGSDLCEFLVVSPAATPAVLARLLGLAPGQPRKPTRIAVDAERVAALLAGADPEEALREYGADRFFALDATWLGPGGEAGRALLALAGPRGWSRLAWESKDQPVFADTSTSELWVALIDLLPHDHEVTVSQPVERPPGRATDSPS